MQTTFVGLKEELLSAEECGAIIEHYESLNALNLTYTRKQEGVAAHFKNDSALSLMDIRTEDRVLPVHAPVYKPFLDKFWPFYNEYLEEFSVLKSMPQHGINFIKIQKTLPGQGYHVWHFEDGSPANMARLMTFIVYLNDVEDGGETGFLYYSKRFKPKTGTALLWPSGFTHTHRGNPPLTGEKYIMTGWIEWC